METSETIQTVEKRTRRIAGGRLRVGSIAGFPIFLHWSLLFLALPLALYWSNGVSFLKITAALFVSVIMHEVAHAAAARLLNFGKGSITVWVLGGYFIPYQMESLPFEMEKDNRLNYVVMVLAGPLSNCVLAILINVSSLSLYPIRIHLTVRKYEFFSGFLKLAAFSAVGWWSGAGYIFIVLFQAPTHSYCIAYLLSNCTGWLFCCPIILFRSA